MESQFPTDLGLCNLCLPPELSRCKTSRLLLLTLSEKSNARKVVKALPWYSLVPHRRRLFYFFQFFLSLSTA